MKPTVTYTKSTGDNSFLVLNVSGDGKPDGDGWELIVVPWYKRVWWQIVNAWEALCGREPWY